ncbi:MAG: condensation domain-containing protein [Sphaerochaetaceae bacterium]|nr:condensation domain-containing protein [Sphaerochaetaceae bacterium]
MERNYYPLTRSQDVVNLQGKYSPFKRLYNILFSISVGRKVEWDIMTKAINLVVERNDCLRLCFEKKDKQLMQYIQDKVVITDIPMYEFKSEEEFTAFIDKYRKPGIDFKHGRMIEPNYIYLADKKEYMVFFKVCHLAVDTYGIANLANDVLCCYDAVESGKELPPAPSQFEQFIIRDIKIKNNKEQLEKDCKFFQDFFKSRPFPRYTGIHSEDNPIWQKQLKKGRKAIKNFMLKSDTVADAKKISADLCKEVERYCTEHRQSMASFMFYVMNMVSSDMHKRVPSYNLNLCNCRGTVSERKTLGTMVQSQGVLCQFDWDKSFAENFDVFSADENQLLRHIGYPDLEFEDIIRKIYNFGVFEYMEFCTFSFVPMSKINGYDFQLYSNGKFPLPAYIMMLYDTETGEATMLYDCQKILTTSQDIDFFHKKFVSFISAIVKSPSASLSEITKN